MTSADIELLITVFLAFISGVIPALIWFFFWDFEDSEHPEPWSMLILAFIGGMVAVFISLFVEKYLFGLGLRNLFYTDFLRDILSVFEKLSIKSSIPLEKLLLVLVFAPIIEEITKYLMARLLVLRTKANDEPIDPTIYMITTALGFAAIENMLFLINPFENRDVVLSIFTGNMRFVGASLLHVVSSATIGLFISFTFFSRRLKRRWAVLVGIISAIIVHGIFNFFMVGSQQSSIMGLELIWFSVIILLLAFEKIKKVKLEQID